MIVIFIILSNTDGGPSVFVFVATAGADAAADKQARWVVMKEDRRLAAKAAELVGRASLRREDNMITNFYERG